jgi:hypothetical protein
VGCGGGSAATTCNSGVCAPPAASSFQICIYQAGDQSCPSTSYTNKQLVYGGISDTRTCTDCSCGSPDGACKGGDALVNGSNPPCGIGGSTIALHSGSCAGVAVSLLSLSGEVTTAPKLDDAGSCAPDGGAPTGSATPTTPITVCCGP